MLLKRRFCCTLTCSYDHDNNTRIKGTIGNTAYPAFDLCLSHEMPKWNRVITHPKKKYQFVCWCGGPKHKKTLCWPMVPGHSLWKINKGFQDSQGNCSVLGNTRKKNKPSLTKRSYFQHIVAYC